MKLLLINYEFPPNGGGAAKATLELAKAFLELGHQVTVWCGGPETRSYNLDGLEIWQVKIPWTKAHKATMWTFTLFVLKSLWLPKNFRTKQFNHCLCFFLFPCGPIALFWNLIFKWPFSVGLRGGDVPGTEPSLNWVHFFLTPIRKWIARRAQFVFANSNGLADLARKTCGPNIEVVPNGVHIPNKISNRNAYPELRLVFAGRFQYQKNLSDMLLGLKKHLTAGHVHLTMIGSGPESQDLKDLVEEWGVADRVTWAGWLSHPQIFEVFVDSDIFILFSHYEGMPNVVLEAAACGVPALVSDVAGNQEVVLNQKTGWITDKDPIALEKKVAEILLNRKAVPLMGAAAKARVQERFTWEKSAKKLLALMDNST